MQFGALERAAELVDAADRAQSGHAFEQFGVDAVSRECSSTEIKIEQLTEGGLDVTERQELLRQATSWHEAAGAFSNNNPFLRTILRITKKCAESKLPSWPSRVRA